MNAENRTLAAEQLLDAWLNDRHFDALPEGGVPETVAEGYAMQAAWTRRLDAAQVGWKLAATNEAGQRHIDVSHPLIGRLFADRVYHAPAALLMRNNRMRVAEAEFAFRLGSALRPRADRRRDEVMDCVDGLFPALEAPDSRFIDFAAAGAPSLTADNACAREFVLGDEAPGGWRDVALDAFIVHVELNGARVASGAGADVLGDPRAALAWFANECGRLGIGLEAGQLVTTGVVGRPVPVRPGDRVRADFGAFGVVEVCFATVEA